MCAREPEQWQVLQQVKAGRSELELCFAVQLCGARGGQRGEIGQWLVGADELQHAAAGDANWAGHGGG